ncbi:MAG: hypothetical protein AAGF11_33420 [Myxococcota bacterium]
MPSTLVLMSCGPTVEPPPEELSSSVGTTEGQTSSASSDGTDGASGGIDGTGGGVDGTSDGTTLPSSTTEPEPSLWTSPDQTYTQVSCSGDVGEPLLFIEAIAPQYESEGQCIPPVSIDFEPWSLVLFHVMPWDGQAGTYVVGDGVAQASIDRIETEPPVGEFSVEVSEPWVPTTLMFTLDGVDGVLDLSSCQSVSDDVPCGGR